MLLLKFVNKFLVVLAVALSVFSSCFNISVVHGVYEFSSGLV